MAVTGDQYTAAAVIAGTFALLYLIVNRVSGQRAIANKRLPPSIGCLPIIGSLLHLPPKKEMHTFFAAKTQELGDVVSFYTGSKHMVVLNSHASIREAFVKRSTDFADRPQLYVMQFTNPGQKGILIHAYDADFKKYHQLSLSILKEFGFGKNIMEIRISAEVQQLMNKIQDLKGQAFEPKSLVATAVINVVSSILFGRGLDNDGKLKDVCFRLVNSVIKDGRALAYEIFPLLRHLPSFGQWIKSSISFQEEFFFEVNKEIDENIRSPATQNFILRFIQQEGEQFDRRQLLCTIRDLIVAGYDSITTTVLWALALLADHPDIQRHLQEEIDSVVPRDRLPSLDDKQKLPYVEAAILELMRFKTQALFGVPHTTMCDTEVGGYSIPKGTMVLANFHAAHMDTHVWDKPHEFRPERFLDEAGCVINRDLMIAFSLGKRSCLGELLARQEVYLFITGLVQQFYIRPLEGVERIDAKDVVTHTLAASPYHIRLIARQIESDTKMMQEGCDLSEQDNRT